ncbi:MAG: response regulator [Desulfobulbaceae bacterium]|nr:response regulator [Desulfobulbaceae bacterium]
MKKTILLVDDEDIFRNRLTRAFTNRGYTVFTAGNYSEAVSAISQHRPALAVVDLKLPDRSGLELIAAAKELHPELNIVVLTGYGSIATAIEATKLGATYYLPKPADVDDIIDSFGKGEAMPRQMSENDFRAPSLARLEWEHIYRVLHDCQGNISAAANKLGLHRRTLQRKLNKYPPNE